LITANGVWVDVTVHGAGLELPFSKPGLPSSCAGVHPPPPLLIVQVNEAEPDAPVVSLAETVTLLVPAVVGVPEISPVEELIDSPAGRPVAEYVSVCPDAESDAETCKLAAVPTVPVRLPGFVTVTVFCVTGLTVSVYVVEWLTEPDVQVMVIE
jgi:hypothetical protein